MVLYWTTNLKMFYMKIALLLIVMSSRSFVAFCQELPGELVDKQCVIYCLNCPAGFMTSHQNAQLINLPSINYDLIKNSACVVGIVEEETSDISQALDNIKLKEKYLLITKDNTSTLNDDLNNLVSFDTFVWSERNKTYAVKRKYSKSLKSAEEEPHESFNRLQDPLRVSVSMFSPFIFKDGDSFTGIDIDIWKLVSELMGIDLQFKLAPHNAATASMVRSGEADVSATSLIYNINWYKGSMDILASLQHQREIAIWTRHPKEVPRIYTIVEPLNWQVWVGTVVSILSVCTVLIIIAKVASKRGHIMSDMFTVSSIGYGIMINEALPDKALYATNKIWSSRVLIWIWLPTSYLISMAYQSQLLAALIKTSTEKSINTFQDVLDQEIIFYVPTGTLTRHLFASSPTPLIQKVNQESILDRNGVYSLDDKGEVPKDIMDNIMEGVGVYENLLMRMHGQRHKFRRATGMDVGIFMCGYYHRLNFPLMTDIGRIIHRIVEHGIERKISDKYVWRFTYPDREFYRNEVVEHERKLSLEDGAPVLVILTILLGGASLAFMREYLFCKNTMDDCEINGNKSRIKVSLLKLLHYKRK